MNSVEVDATKLAWRVDEAGAGLDSEPWSLDSEAGSLDSVEVDARKPAFDVTPQKKLGFRSLDSGCGEA